ncbi:thioredoxin family protein [Snuella sedimenti]|uniref:Thioredoxin fold domain-containing protein n=1 Tax=Snuella sedimenti TaxID=2798802 RepID=A0A8J7IF27_9FLAO|nr:thioredoxin fold domain-containing protein [Snuella sedimenti]MBJ6366483.1 thioredoxin fold domain-containing protein [Snuella sedimenti]
MMKRIGFTLILALLTLVTSKAQEINWVTLQEAVALQKKNPKKIMIDMYTNWCGPCKMLDKNTFRNEDVANYVNKHYYAVKFNAEGNDVVAFKDRTFKNPGYKPENANRRNSPHELSRYFQITAYPTIVFLDEKGELIAPIKGYKKPQDLELYLKLFKADAHKDMDTQEKFNAYYKAFKPEFQG